MARQVKVLLFDDDIKRKGRKGAEHAKKTKKLSVLCAFATFALNYVFAWGGLFREIGFDPFDFGTRDGHGELPAADFFLYIKVIIIETN